MPLPTPLLAVAALVAVLGLIWLLARAVRGAGWVPGGPRPPGDTGPGLALAGSLALDPRRRVHLLRCGDRHVLVLTGGPQDLVLGWVPAAPAEPAEPGP